MNPALEAYFGRPETVSGLGTSLEQASTRLMQLKVTLDGRVSSLVPAKWQGPAASAFQKHWEQRSTAIGKAANTADRLGNEAQRLGSTLQEARALFQRAETHATQRLCMITGWYEVVPMPGLNPTQLAAAEAAAPGIQVEVTTAMQLADGAREEARAVVSLVQSDLSSIVTDLGQAGLQMMYGLGQWGSEMRNLAQQDWSTIGATLWHGVQSFAKSIASGMATAGKYYLDEGDAMNPERVAEVQKNMQELAARLNVTPTSQLTREGTKLAVNVVAAVAPIGGGAKAAGGALLEDAGKVVAEDAGKVVAEDAGKVAAEDAGRTVVDDAGGVAGEHAPQPVGAAVTEDTPSGWAHSQGEMEADYQKQVETNKMWEDAERVRTPSDEYRAELTEMHGAPPTDGLNYDAHHQFPVEYGQQFQKMGIDPNNPAYGTWVSREDHWGLSSQYSRDWESFFQNNPNATRADAYKFANELADKYGYQSNVPAIDPGPVTPLAPWPSNGGPPL